MPRRNLNVLATLLLTGLAGFAVPASVSRTRAAEADPKPSRPPQERRGPRPYVIESPDILSIKASKRLGLPQSFGGKRLVRPDGMIDLDEYGRVFVVGLTPEQTALAVARHLTANAPCKHLSVAQIEKELQVRVESINSKTCHVIIESADASDRVIPYICAGDDTVLDAIAVVQGLPAIAGRGRLWVERSTSPQLLLVDWKGIAQNGDARTNYALKPGDRIHFKRTGEKAPHSEKYLRISVRILERNSRRSQESDTVRVLAEPLLVTRDGTPFTFAVDGERGRNGQVVQGTATLGKEPGAVRLEATLDNTCWTAMGKGTKDRARMHTERTGIAGSFKVGEVIKLEWRKTGGRQVWAELAVEEVK